MSGRLESLDRRRDHQFPIQDDFHHLPAEFMATVGASHHARNSSLSSAGIPVHTRTHSQPATDLPPPHKILQFISKLPPAVANVPPDDLKSYTHQKRVGNYLLSKTLGEGSFAKVKEGLNALVGEKVAVKIIDKKKAQQDSYVAKNFRREAKLLQMVNHPNILQLLEVIETDNSYYLITELCTGGELMNHIYKHDRLEEKETRRYMRQIVSAVDHLHKAGIIHRDLKVENLMLDAEGNIKIIDFGLSNQEYVEAEGGRHCETQCGSPAYAAPELLGRRQYGPEVDVWSLGVNMYAMLTGCLPYTVEPFNITALHAKMLDNDMNPIPQSISEDGKDLLKKLLTAEPSKRIKIADVMRHPWITAERPLEPLPYPNRLRINDIDEDIVEHMTHVLKLKETEKEVTDELLTDRASSIAAIYYLLCARLRRYKKQRPVMTRKIKPHRHHGEDNSDAFSIVSCPAHAQLEAQRRRISHENPRALPHSAEHSRAIQRRNSLPGDSQLDDVHTLNQKPLPPIPHHHGQKAATLPPRTRRRPETTFFSQRNHSVITQEPVRHPAAAAGLPLNPVRPPTKKKSMRVSKSHPRELNKVSSVPVPWKSQPTSPSESFNSPPPDSDLVFHRVHSSAFGSVQPLRHTSHGTRKISLPARMHTSHSDGDHLPVIYLDDSSRDHFHSQRKSLYGDRHNSVSNKESFSTNKHKTYRDGHPHPVFMKCSVLEVVGKLHRAAEIQNITFTNQNGNMVSFKSSSVHFQVQVVEEEGSGGCHLKFHWVSGGSREHFEELSEKIIRMMS